MLLTKPIPYQEQRGRIDKDAVRETEVVVFCRPDNRTGSLQDERERERDRERERQRERERERERGRNRDRERVRQRKTRKGEKGKQSSRQLR